MSSCDSDIDARLRWAENHHKQHRTSSPPESPVAKKVDSWELKHVGLGGDLAAQASGEFPKEAQDADLGLASSTQQRPLSPPDSNTGTPTRPVAQRFPQYPLTSDDTHEPQRIPEWQPFESKNLLQIPWLAGRGRPVNRSTSSKRASSNRSYYPALEQLPPSPHHRYQRRPGSDASSISSHSGTGVNCHYSDSGDIFHTPSQSPSHTPSHFSVQSRNLTDGEGDEQSDPFLSPTRTPQGSPPFSAYDLYNEEIVTKQINAFDRVTKSGRLEEE